MRLKGAIVAMHVLLGGLSAGVFSAGVEERDAAEIVVQVSLTAGLRYHDARAVWDQMKEGESLVLVREPENPHDMNAVRVDWKGHPLGYIPRTENAAVARQMDRGTKLQARITKLTRYRNNHRKLEFEVFLPL
jgi:HIRAN domain